MSARSIRRAAARQANKAAQPTANNISEAQRRAALACRLRSLAPTGADRNSHLADTPRQTGAQPRGTVRLAPAQFSETS